MRLSKILNLVTALFFGVSLSLSIERQIKLGLNFDGNLSLTLAFEEDQSDNDPEINLSTKQNQTILTKDVTVEQNDININKANLIHQDDDGQDQSLSTFLDHVQDIDPNINVGINGGSSNNNENTHGIVSNGTNQSVIVVRKIPASAKIFVKAQTDGKIVNQQQLNTFKEQQGFNKDLYLNKVYKLMVTLMRQRELNDKIKQIYDQLLEYEDSDSNDNQ
ncbi:UNKNOWN [Stylonychia lemnae]|uniref:Uncharacterized protein n=1 Tax=Stylonychia lemnae TaxID=5949 RepID=A0A078A2S5_STYLE|nr:UNKNOWN [Stylonychia lemnae]|eukprot:CDW76400.1 UNKNOWN [Stylonychia lemnae]